MGGKKWSGQKLQGWEAERHPWEQGVESAERGFRQRACLRREPSGLGGCVPLRAFQSVLGQEHPPRVHIRWRLGM